MNMNEMEGGLNVTLTIRLLMHGKEVGSIIGKKGETVKKMREESGARINISDGSSPERIVTITGSSEVIFKAFAMIAEKFEEDILASMINSTVTSRPPVTLRLVFPASQCGSLIGKGGSKIKEIREVDILGRGLIVGRCAGFVMQVTASAVVICTNLNVLSVPQAFTIPGQFAIPPQDLTKLHQLAMQHIPFTSLGQSNPTFPGLEASFVTTSHELSIPNDLIGCIIGRQGSKINEIRQMSGAQIKIAGATDGSAVRHVTITGSPANISVAQYLISASLEMAKLSIQAALSSSSSTPIDLSLGFSQSTPSTSSSMAVLAAPPSAINVHSPSSIPSAHYALPVSSLLGMKTVPLLAMHTATSAGLPAGLTPYTTKIPTSSSIKKSERQKFAPY
ncbi:poly(rC)-binding protein 3-like [Sinocyclocheilus grahami]|uniref:poly(rC)-binding protein 3-like n=1 Tax=Sinocyclocheilus grahami TaxID=75366 RepID=UPI0007ACF03B|nr:PREDICTED: poly(rC)-binding protein 3-like [Sinocyclocheilus grahami]